MKIMKFGGAVLKSKTGFESMVNILKNTNERPLLLVISAFSDATRQLQKAALIAEEGNEKEAIGILEQVISDNLDYADVLFNNIENINALKSIFEDKVSLIKNYLRGVSITRELSPRTLDAILSLGEFLALNITHLYLKEQKFDIECINATDLIISDSQYGSAKPLLKETEAQVKKRLIPSLKETGLVLTQGFVARNKQGEITTMGIESSNLTAALLSELLNCKELTLWTDVPGFRTADPKIVEDTRLHGEFDYTEAYKLALNGFKLIYPAMLENAARKGIRLIYRSAFSPDGEFSEISSKSSQQPGIPIIIYKDKLSLIKINTKSSTERKDVDLALSKLQHSNGDMLLNESNPDYYMLLGTRTFIHQLKNIGISNTIYNGITLITVFYLSSDYFSKVLHTIPKLADRNPYFLRIDSQPGIIKIAVKDEDAAGIVRVLHSAIFQ